MNENPENFRNTEKNAHSDEQIRLLLAARSGDSDAFAKLAEAYRPMLEAAVSQYRAELPVQDFEELQQEALVAFHRAVNRYDLLYGDVSFGLYAKICVNKGVISALRQYWRKRKNADIVSLEDAAGKLSGAFSDPSQAVIEREKVNELRARISGSLSEFENTVWWLHYSGMSDADIAERTGKSAKSVGNALCRIRRKLRALLS